MKFVNALPISLDTMLGTQLNLTLTLILLGEAAEGIVCDQRQAMTNLVCSMNISGVSLNIKAYQDLFNSSLSTE